LLTAHDGADALSVAAGSCVDVAILDIGMPGMNGYELARRIRLQPWGRVMLLVAVTGWGQESDKRQARAAGFDHHFTKPVDPDEITQLLRQYGGRLSRSG
jgi:CheY-like chemotaxis protein